MPKRLVLLLVPLLAATSCPPRMEIRNAPSPAAQPTFAFSVGGRPLESLRGFEVAQCRPAALRRPLWRVSRPAGAADSLSWDRMEEADSSTELRITYGRVPEGFREEVAPEPLVPGRCYLALGSMGYGSGAREFSLTADGRVELGRGSGYYAVPERELNRAGVHCKRGYQVSRSAGDTAAVDTRVHAVADTSVTCGTLRAEHPEVLNAAMSRETRVGILAISAVAAAVGIASELHRDE